MDKIVFIVLHSESDGSEIMINPFAIESVRGNSVNLHEHYYDVRESYEEIKKLIEEKLKIVYLNIVYGG